MKKEDIPFKMTDEMYEILKEFIILKSNNPDRSKNKKVENQLKEYRDKLISEFRKNNIDEIKQYEALKDKI